MYLENEKPQRLPKELFNKPFPRQSRMVYFYCCLLNNIAIAIIKATFMIVVATNP